MTLTVYASVLQSLSSGKQKFVKQYLLCMSAFINYHGYKFTYVGVILDQEVHFDSALNAAISNAAQRMQNRALRAALGAPPGTPLNELHRNTNCMFFNVRAKFNLLKKMFHRVRLEYVDEGPNSTILTRSSDAPSFVLPTPRNSRYSRSLHSQGGMLWNNLPTSLRSIPDHNLFKSYLKRYLITTN